MYYLQVAADIFGSKTNFELSFNARPSITELSRAVEVAFSNEISLRRPEGVPQHSFHVSKFKVYDEERSKWVDLQSEAQLSDSGQLYAFQPENPWHKESQKEIPPAVKPPPPSAVAASRGVPSLSRAPAPVSSYAVPATQTARAPAVLGARPSVPLDATEDEKIRTVFAEFDSKGQRVIELEDLRNGFRVLGIDFTTATLNDLFQKGDLNHDGRISQGEFESFARMYPIMIDCLFYRSKAFYDDQVMQRELDAEKEAVRQANGLVSQADAAQKAAAKAAEDTQQQIVDADADIKDRANRLRQVQLQLEQAQRDKERAQKEKYDRENEAVEARDRERVARAAQQEAAREVEKHDRKLQGLAQDAAKADDRVKQLQAQLTMREYDRL